MRKTSKEITSEAFRVLNLVQWLATRKMGTKHSSDASEEITFTCRQILKEKNHEYWRSMYYD